MARRDYVQDKGKVTASSVKSVKIFFNFLRFIQQIQTINHFWIFLESIRTFLAEFCQTNDDGKKIFKYATQLVHLAHRDQVCIINDKAFDSI